MSVLLADDHNPADTPHPTRQLARDLIARHQAPPIEVLAAEQSEILVIDRFCDWLAEQGIAFGQFTRKSSGWEINPSSRQLVLAKYAKVLRERGNSNGNQY